MKTRIPGAHSEHHARTEKPLRDLDLPVVRAIVQASRTSHARCSVRPLRVKVGRLPPAAEQFDFVRLLLPVPGPVVVTALQHESRQVGVAVDHRVRGPRPPPTMDGALMAGTLSAAPGNVDVSIRRLLLAVPVFHLFRTNTQILSQYRPPAPSSLDT